MAPALFGQAGRAERPESELKMRYLTFRDVAERLGVPVKSVYELYYKQGLPVTRLSPRRLRVREDELEKWLRGRAAAA